MKIQIENKDHIILNLTPAEAVVLGEYLEQIKKTSKPQRGILNPAKLASNLQLFADWLINGIRHEF